jgi:tetratricopeptide (TPR) repeat protein
MNSLRQIVSDADADESLIHIAAFLAHYLDDIKLIDTIVTSHANVLCAKPWAIVDKESKVTENHDQLDAIEKLLDTNPDDWIALQAHLFKAAILYLVPEAFDSLLSAENLLDANPELDCFRDWFYLTEILLRRYEGDVERVSILREKALKKSREYDDPLSEIAILIQQTEFMMNIDITRAMEFTQTAHVLASELGVPSLKTMAIQGVGMVSAVLGEYDLALHAWIESVEELQARGAPECHSYIRIAQLYADLGEGKNALEWAKIAMEVDERSARPGGLDDHICPHVAMANALIIAGKLDEAEKYIHKSHEIALRSGQELLLSMYYYVQGLFEIASGDASSGKDSLTRALEISDRTNGHPARLNRILLALTKAEIDLYESQGRSDIDPSDSGPWMHRLEHESRKKGLQGIQMQHALLKAEFQEKMDLTNVAIGTLENALSNHDSLGVISLRNQILSKIQELKERPPSP